MAPVERVELGRTGERVSAMGLGIWQWGSRGWGWNREYRREDVRGAFERALDLGIDFFDTAEIYGGGRSEELLGDLMRGMRDEVFVATKVLPWRVTAKAVERAADASLRRLRTDVIDLYQLHFPMPIVPTTRVVRAMERLVKKGKVRYLGVSNLDARGLRKAREALASEDIVSNQVRYSLLHRGIERELLPYAQETDVTIIAYSPLAQGALTGRYTRESIPHDLVRSANSVFSPGNLRQAAPVVEALKRIGASRNVTPAQVALNWILGHPCVLPIPGAKTAAHVMSSAGAAGWRLTEAERDELDRVSRDVRMRRWSALPWTAGRAIRAALFRGPSEPTT